MDEKDVMHREIVIPLGGNGNGSVIVTTCDIEDVPSSVSLRFTHGSRSSADTESNVAWRARSDEGDSVDGLVAGLRRAADLIASTKEALKASEAARPDCAHCSLQTREKPVAERSRGARYCSANRSEFPGRVCELYAGPKYAGDPLWQCIKKCTRAG